MSSGLRQDYESMVDLYVIAGESDPRVRTAKALYEAGFRYDWVAGRPKLRPTQRRIFRQGVRSMRRDYNF